MEFEEIFEHRIDPSSRRDLASGWTEYRATKSAKTLAKFVSRARGEGFSSCRLGYSGTVIVRTSELS